jgi:hypothetical protein
VRCRAQVIFYRRCDRGQIYCNKDCAELSRTVLEAQMLRYYHVENWPCGTIARQLHVHRGTVQRVLAQAGLPRIGTVQRPSQTGVPSVHPWDAEEVSVAHSPRPVAGAYLRFRTLPGEQAECEWGRLFSWQLMVIQALKLPHSAG